MTTTPQAALLSEIMQALNFKDGGSYTIPRVATVEKWQARYNAIQAAQEPAQAAQKGGE